MIRTWMFLLLGLALALGTPALAGAQPSGPMPRDVGWEPHIGSRAAVDVALTDEHGERARVADYLSPGRPLILVFAYHECPMLCSLVLNGVASALRKIELTPGRDFEIVVVSIDPTDTPARAGEKKAVFTRQYDHPGAEGATHFLVGAETGVRELARSVGFKYEYDPIGRQYGHAGGLVVLTGEGTISHYFYGIDFSPRDVRLGLVEAAKGAVGGVTDRLMLLCFRYDPSRGKYAALALGSVRVGGIATVLALGLWITFVGRRGPRRPERGV